MAVIDELRRSAQQKTEITEKTESAVDAEARLQALIADEDAKLDDNYRLLGKTYMERHASDYEEAFTMFAQQILSAKKTKLAYQRELMSLKGIVFCENCGSEVPENALFCCSCGNKMPDPKIDIPAGHTRCGGCGAIQPVGIRFCMNCGSALSATASTQLEQMTGVPSQTETALIEETTEITSAKDEEKAPQSAVQPARCFKCGSVLEEDALFCSDCGARQEQRGLS